MKLKVINNIFLKDKYFLLELLASSHFKTASPGQFLHIRIEDSCDPLLRRPMSIHDVRTGRKTNSLIAKVLYEVVGKGTQLLSQKGHDSEIDVLGPLGNDFEVKQLKDCQRVYIVAGGMGVAPLFFLGKKITEIQKSKIKNQIVILIGAKTKKQLLCEKEFRKLGCEVRVATEDGSKGFRGKVTDLLRACLAASRKPQATGKKTKKPIACSLKPEAAICACGPRPMLAVISEIAHNHHIPAQVSLEEFMGCGLGACLGCVVRTTSGYKRICHDGPVFDANEIIWKE